jgi:hypothetical protein
LLIGSMAAWLSEKMVTRLFELGEGLFTGHLDGMDYSSIMFRLCVCPL